MIIFIKKHRSTRRNNSLHPGYLTSLVTRTNHNTIQTIGIYVRVFRTADHAVQIFIPHRLGRLEAWLLPGCAALRPGPIKYKMSAVSQQVSGCPWAVPDRRSLADT